MVKIVIQNIDPSFEAKIFPFFPNSVSGVDVMIKIISDFLPFFSEKWRLLKNQSQDKIFAITINSLGKKGKFFRQIFRRKYFSNYNIRPRSRRSCNNLTAFESPWIQSV
jgi:hypothetical protein